MTPRALYAPARLAGAPLLRTQTDERLVDLVRAGNDGAFEAIVARYRRPLLRYCSGLLPEGRAEDAVQQTFLRAYDALRASEGEMNLRPWLYKIAHNQSLNALRDRSLAFEELPESIDGVERPDQAFEKHERLRDTLAAVSALPERQRNAIVLRELEGRSYEEIAIELGVTGGAVRALLNRARGTLRSGATALTPIRPDDAAAVGAPRSRRGHDVARRRDLRRGRGQRRGGKALRDRAGDRRRGGRVATSGRRAGRRPRRQQRRRGRGPDSRRLPESGTRVREAAPPSPETIEGPWSRRRARPAQGPGPRNGRRGRSQPRTRR